MQFCTYSATATARRIACRNIARRVAVLFICQQSAEDMHRHVVVVKGVVICV